MSIDIGVPVPAVARRHHARGAIVVRRSLSAGLLVVLFGTAATRIAFADSSAPGTAAYHRGNYTRAVRELTPLAERGNARALARLGFMYEHGFGVPQAYVPAADLYARAAAQGNPSAQAMLGLMYDKGHGVPQNFVLAYKWLDLAAAHAPARQRETYLRLRDAVSSKMSSDEIAEGQRLAFNWRPERW